MAPRGEILLDLNNAFRDIAGPIAQIQRMSNTLQRRGNAAEDIRDLQADIASMVEDVQNLHNRVLDLARSSAGGGGRKRVRAERESGGLRRD